MSAGCIPNKKDRVAVLRRAVSGLEEALRILKSLEDPDRDPRELETAWAIVSAAAGHYDDAGLDQNDPDAPPKPGIQRLLEHYFS